MEKPCEKRGGGRTGGKNRRTAFQREGVCSNLLEICVKQAGMLHLKNLACSKSAGIWGRRREKKKKGKKGRCMVRTCKERPKEVRGGKNPQGEKG